MWITILQGSQFFVFWQTPNPTTLSAIQDPHTHQTPTGRPIVSTNSCPTERISGLVDLILRPFVKDLPSFIEDTTHLIKLIETHPPIAEGVLLVTLNVVSLYTYINMIEALKVAKTTVYDSHKDPMCVVTRPQTQQFWFQLGNISFKFKVLPWEPELLPPSPT